MSGTLENVGMTVKQGTKTLWPREKMENVYHKNSKHFINVFQLDHIHETDGVVAKVQLLQASKNKTEQKKYINQPPSKPLHCSTLSF